MRKLVSVLALGLTLAVAVGTVGAQAMDGDMMKKGQVGKAEMQMHNQMMDMMAAKGMKSMMDCDCMGSKMGMGGKGKMSIMAGKGKMSMMGGKGMMPMMKNMGMGAMMMGGGPGMMDSKDRAAYMKFMEESRDTRKELHDLRFNYMEARWNPDTTIGELQKMAEKIDQLQTAITEKMPK